MIYHSHQGYYTGKIFLDGEDVTAVCFMADDGPDEDGQGTVVLFVTKSNLLPHSDWKSEEPEHYKPAEGERPVFFFEVGFDIGSPLLMVKSGNVEITPGEIRPREIPK